jgi:hypothetical protein
MFIESEVAKSELLPALGDPLFLQKSGSVCATYFLLTSMLSCGAFVIWCFFSLYWLTLFLMLSSISFSLLTSNSSIYFLEELLLMPVLLAHLFASLIESMFDVMFVKFKLAILNL